MTILHNLVSYPLIQGDHKQHEDSLIHDWELYTQLISFMNEAVWVGDKDEKTVYVNPQFCELMEYDLVEILGRESYDFWDTESAKVVKKVNHTERRLGKASSYEGNLKTKSGKIIPVLLSGAPLPNGGTVGIMTDLSELRKKEKSEKILSQAIEQAGDGIILVTLGGIIQSWNRGARKIFGYKSQDIVGVGLQTILPGLQSGNLEILMKGGDSKEYSIMHKTDGERIIQITFSPIHEEGIDNHTMFLCIVRDITHQKRVDLELELRYKKIKDAYDWLGTVQRQSDYISDLISIASSTYNFQKILRSALHGLITLSGVDGCLIYSYDAPTQKLFLESHFGIDGDIKLYKNTQYSGSWTERAMLQEIPYHIMDLAKEKNIPIVQRLLEEGFVSSITLPLRSPQCGCVGSLIFLMKPATTCDIYHNTFLLKYIQLIEIIFNTRISEKTH